MGRIVKWNKGTVKSREDARFEQELNSMIQRMWAPITAAPRAKPRARRRPKDESPSQLKIEYRQPSDLPF